MNGKTIKVHPLIFKYKNISFQVNEKDDNVSIDITSIGSPIQTTYNPCHTKGHQLCIKTEYNSSEKQLYKEPGMNLLFHINTSLCWYVGINETEFGITIDIYTGSFPMYVDQVNKMMTTSSSSTSNSNSKYITTSTHNHSLNIKILNPIN